MDKVNLGDEKKIYFITYLALIILALGIFTSVSVLSLYHILILIPGIYFTKKCIKEGYQLPFSSYALSGLVLAGVLSNLSNINDLENPVKSFGKLKYFIFCILMIFPIKALFKNYIGPKQVKIILNIFFFTIISASLFGFLNNILEMNITSSHTSDDGFKRIAGFTGTMRFGYGMGMVLTMLVGVFFHRNSFKRIISPKFFILTLFIGFIGFILTYTRGAALALVCSAPLILWYVKKKYALWSIMGIFILMISALLVILKGGNDSSRFLLKVTDKSNLMRLSQYESALIAFSEKPILGHGVNQFINECERIKDKYNIWWKDYCIRIGFKCGYDKSITDKHYCGHSHNVFIETMANTGAVGFLFFFAWLLIWIYELIKRNDLMSKIYLPAILYFVIASQFEMMLDANNSFLIFFLYPLSFLKKEDLGNQFSIN